MKQKYLISILPETEQLFIREYAELGEGEFAFVCEEIHDAKVLREAMPHGIRSIVSMVRRPNMYPRQDFGEKIARGIIDLLRDETGMTSREILINDTDVFTSSDTDFDPRVVTADNCSER